jgi:hypothetical protein
MPQKEKAHQNGGPIPNAIVCQDRAESNSELIELQARILNHRFAIGYCLAAELTLIVWELARDERARIGNSREWYEKI